MNQKITERDFFKELQFSASRSSGAGGQNVNKVSTKVELRFIINQSTLLTDEEKKLLLLRLANRINQKGELILTEQSERSQIKNKHKVIEKFINLLSNALKIKKKRLPTNPTKSSQLKRLEHKKKLSTKKILRKKEF